MRVVKPEKKTEFYPNVAQAAWGLFCARNACGGVLRSDKADVGGFRADASDAGKASGSATSGARGLNLGGGASSAVIAVLDSAAECEFFYSKLKYFLTLEGVSFDIKILPDPSRGADSQAARFDAMCERIGTLRALASATGGAGSGGDTVARGEKIAGAGIAGRAKTGGLGTGGTETNNAGASGAKINGAGENGAKIGGTGSPAIGAERPLLFVVATAESLFAPAPNPSVGEPLELSKGLKISPAKVAEKLVAFGYYNETLCEAPGQFAVRGGIIDVYPVSADAPVRLDFFGDEIDSVSKFDPNTQLADSKIYSTTIDSVPDSENACTGAWNACDYLGGGAVQWIFFEPAQLAARSPLLFQSAESDGVAHRGFGEIFARGGDSFTAVSSLETRSETFEDSEEKIFPAEPIAEIAAIDGEVGADRFESETHSREKFARKLADWGEEGIAVFVASDGAGDEKLALGIFESAGRPFKGKFVPSGFGEGFVVRDFGINRPNWEILPPDAKGAAFVGTRELFGRRQKNRIEPRRRMLSRRAQVDQLLDFSELCEGDYVVHLGHGICRYHGLTKLETDGKSEEVVKLEFEDGAMLYLPLHKSHLLSRYIGLDKRHPKLSRLDSKSWTKVKTAAELAALDYAAELLELQSRREIAKGYAFPEDDQWQRDFEDSFPFVETPDQLRAAAEVKADMESEKPMDRLLCADVGFGKTEIAMRAVFKCAMAGRQAAVLCPTTVLCQQHFINFRERFAGYPIVVEMLSRFRTKAECDKIRAQLAAGQIDVLIGTHAMLSDSTIFKDLGLLVIDEEHRFGVKHKEKIKKLKSGVDVLSMSATPIPRTLYFAMMGARTMSIMETPPKDRFPVETLVKEYSPEIVREAIEREVSRGGQVFYLHNRVKTIEETAEGLRKMFPKLRIGVGHGQMSEHALEKLMSKFVEGKYDILVCTTIIESGLDIPNCNTIIIEGADKFGLAQLYQLRGRVGRFTRRAYAWLLLHRHAGLVESARKRLGAIRQYNKPGAGFRIATRDLQLRGCGNLLGAKQSGHIAGVGFDLYCALLKRSIALLKGDKKTSGVLRSQVNFDFVRLGEGERAAVDVSQAENYFQEIRIREISDGGSETVNAYIPESYIPQTQLRIDLYRRLSMAASKKELDGLLFETKNRFGAIPDPLKFCFYVERLRILAESQNILSLETQGDKLKILLPAPNGGEYFKVGGHFPVLTKRRAVAKLQEIEKYLTYTLPSIRKK